METSKQCTRETTEEIMFEKHQEMEGAWWVQRTRVRTC